MDRDEALGGLDIDLREQGSRWECRDHFCQLVHRHVGEGAEVPVNAIIHAQPRRERQVRNEPPFSRISAFRDDAEAVDVAWGERYLD